MIQTCIDRKKMGWEEKTGSMFRKIYPIKNTFLN